MTVAAVDGSEDKRSSPAVVGGSVSLLSKLGNLKGLVAKKPKAEKAPA
jgi:hypothetical protein